MTNDEATHENRASVILSEAKDHLEMLYPRKMILRFAQDDSALLKNRTRES